LTKEFIDTNADTFATYNHDLNTLTM